LCRLSRWNNQFRIGVLWGRLALKNKHSKDHILFCEKYLHNYPIYDELSICCANMGLNHEALHVAKLAKKWFDDNPNKDAKKDENYKRLCENIEGMSKAAQDTPRTSIDSPFDLIKFEDGARVMSWGELEENPNFKVTYGTGQPPKELIGK